MLTEAAAVSARLLEGTGLWEKGIQVRQDKVPEI